MIPKNFIAQLPLVLICWLAACVCTYLCYFHDVTLVCIPLIFAVQLLFVFRNALPMKIWKAAAIQIIGCYLIVAWVGVLGFFNLKFILSSTGMAIAITSSMLLIYYLNTFIFQYKILNWGLLLPLVLGVLLIPIANLLYDISVIKANFKYPFLLIVLWQLFSVIAVGISIPTNANKTKWS